MSDWGFLSKIGTGLSKIGTGAVDLVCDTGKGVVNTAKNTTYSVGSLLSGNTDKAAQYAKAAGAGVTDTFKNGAAALGNVVEGTAQLTEGTFDGIQKGAHAIDDFIPSQNTAQTETNELPEAPIEVIQTKDLPPMFETAPTTTAQTETNELPETPIEVIQTKDLPPMFETAPTETPCEEFSQSEVLDAADEERLIAEAGKEAAKAEEAKNPKPTEVSKQPTQSSQKGGELKLDVIEAYASAGDVTQLLNENEEKNYYRSNLFDNIKKATQATPEVEEVVAHVIDELDSPTARDAQAYDIAAKSAGVGGFKDMFGKGKGTDAYKMFLDINNDDFTIRETEYKGKKETKAYLDKDKTDGEITVFGSEIVNGKEHLTLVDKDGKVHYFDKANQLSEVKFNH